MTSDPNADIQRTKTEARQGTTRPKMLYVLIGGIVLVCIAFALVWMFSHGSTHPT